MRGRVAAEALADAIDGDRAEIGRAIATARVQLEVAEGPETRSTLGPRSCAGEAAVDAFAPGFGRSNGVGEKYLEIQQKKIFK